MRSIHTSITTAIIAVMCAACEHATKDVVAPATPQYTVKLHMSVGLRYDGHSYDLASVYTDDFGHAFQLDTFRFLVSHAYAVDEGDHVLADFYASAFLVDAAQPSNDHLLGDLTSDHLHEVRFNFGLDPIANHADLTSAPVPLNDPSMHGLTAADGYYFLQVTGRVDSNGDGTIDAADQAFRFNCMGDDLLCSGATPVHESLLADGILTVALPIDMKTLLSSIDLLNTPSATGTCPVNAAWMQRLKDATEQEH